MTRRIRSSSVARLPAPTRALREFLATETAGGVLLVAAAAVAMIWVNSPWKASYVTFWHTELGMHLGAWQIELDLRDWVNEGLMAIFFLVVGLEVKRELVLGELRDRRRAMLPVVAAVGGMVVPALLYLAVNPSGPESAGWGIPMATDIAFAIGVLALVARTAPSPLRLFLLTLAIVDDIGSIVVIAVVYSATPDAGWLAVAALIVAAVVFFRRAGFSATPLFATLGVCLWLALHASGVHATIAGVIMGLLAPSSPALSREIVRSRSDELLDVFSPEAARQTTRLARQSVSQLEWLEHHLHGWSSLVIVPVFALANAGVVLTADTLGEAWTRPVTLGVLVGLVVGKPLGILAASGIAVRTGVADLPEGVTPRQLAGAGALAGIGFTVSIFIATLAFDDVVAVEDAKIGVLGASILASLVAAFLLRGATARRGDLN